ncbi:hypothetical protein CHS0354_006265 [Potamilus streckersoni]|uniref:Cytokine receptor n=1 Tax=Potamilus streckersoni TaxID=2493646 RepID=A0AAE0SM95_9BIVA|nr:hypothetical protein CHS0354_006265 [Potamilus streckersoni]
MLLQFMLSCLTCALTSTADSAIVSTQCGDIEPVDPYAFIGERLVLTCAIRDVNNNKTVSLYFDTKVNNNSKWSHEEVYQTGYEITQLNSTAIRLTSPVLTVDDALRHNKSRSYKCMVREVVNNCTERSKKFVKNEHVKIDYYPHNLENFSCQVYNWDKLTCTWDMIPYFHKEDIKVECFWTIDQKLKGSETKIEWSQCPNDSFTSFTMHEFITVPEYYWFYFNITNTVRMVVKTSDVFRIYSNHIVKPAPVDSISFQNVTDTCVTVIWSHSRNLRKKMFTVRYTSKCSSAQQITTQELKVTVCDLNPYTNYRFVVDSRPVDLESKGAVENTIGFTSDPRDGSVTTKPAVPAANPKLLSYTDEPCTVSPCRKVLVFWEPLSPCDLHDSPSGQQYEIIIKQRGFKEAWNYVATDSKAISHTLMVPDEDKVYDVKLRVITGTGKKREDFSHLVIWPRKQSPIAPSMVVEYDTMKNGSDFYITLNLTEAQSQTSQILYWCHGQRGSGCQEAMSFMEVNGSSAEIFIGNYVMDFNIFFGVESQQLLSGEITRSGIQMGTCIYKKNLKPLIPPKNFRIAQWLPEREGELFLQWDPYDCNSPNLESGYVLSYTLYICQVTDESSCKFPPSSSISVQRHMHNYTITKLMPSSRYKVWLTARTSAGEGPPTDLIDTYIYMQEFPLWGKVMIGVSSIVVPLVLLFCFVKIYQYIKGRREAYSQIEVPETRILFDDYVKISNGHVQQENDHVDEQTTEFILDMDENEELGKIIPLISNGDAKISKNSKSSRTNVLLAFGQDDPMQRQLDMPFLGYKDDGSFISSNDMNSVSSDTESDRDTKDEKEIKPVVFVLLSELGRQNASLLPEGYCRAVGYGDYVPNGKTNPALYEDRLDKTFFKLQGQAVHSQSIDSLLNDGPELRGLDECKGNSSERDKDVHFVCVKDSSNLSQENVTIEKQIETGQMKVKDDFESDELALSGDDLDDAASDDSLSLWDEICGKLHKTEKTSGYVCADEVLDEVGEALLSDSYFSFDAGSHLDEVNSGSDNDQDRYEPNSVIYDINHVSSEMNCVRYENDNVRSETDSVRSENNHVTFGTDEIIHTGCATGDSNNYVRCDDYIVSTNDNTATSIDENGDFSNNFEQSCIDSCYHSSEVEDSDPAVNENHLNILQKIFPENQENEVMDTCFNPSENSGPEIVIYPSNKISTIEVFPNGLSVKHNPLTRVNIPSSIC